MKELLKTETNFILGITFGMIFMLFMLFNLGILKEQKNVEIVSIEKEIVIETEPELVYGEINLTNTKNNFIK